MGFTFCTDNVETKQASNKQKKYVRNLLKVSPELGEPADWSAHTIRMWLDRAKEALGPLDGPSPVSVPESTELELWHDICGDPMGDALRDEMRSAIGEQF